MSLQPSFGSDGNNLCTEVPIPTGTEHNWCTLGMSQALIDYLPLGHIWQTQIHARFKELYGAKKIIQSFYSGATPDQLMDPMKVIEHARALYDSCDPEDPEAFTKLDNTLDAIRAVSFEERSKLFGSFAVQHALKEKGIMTATTQQLEAFQSKLEQKPHQAEALDSLNQQLTGGTKLGEAVVLGANNTGKSRLTEELIKQIEASTGQKVTVSPKLRSLEPRKPKRKKSKAKSPHIPNMRNATVKRALGASILMKLGQVQQDTQDAMKKALLKELPAADLIESATGQALPDYQANLINGFQAKADPDAPVVKRMGEHYAESIDDDAPANPTVEELVEVGKQ